MRKQAARFAFDLDANHDTPEVHGCAGRRRLSRRNRRCICGDWIVDAKTGCKVCNPNPAAAETVNWTGACGAGLAEGKGVLDWLKGGKTCERDEGEWSAGRQTGEGSQIWPGGQYKGQLSDSLPMVAAC